VSSLKIFSHAPTRIDLAGGTLDIWPIYLFLKDALTLNVGINLYAEAVLEEKKTASAKGIITLRSEDQKTELKLEWDELEKIQPHPTLELHVKFLRYFAKQKKPSPSAGESDLFLSTLARSPAGAGLGGSSTLSIAIVGALGSWARGKSVDPAQEGERFIELVRDVETTVIRVPAGLQDYYGAMYGGLQTIRWMPVSHQRESLPLEILSELEKRLLLFYSGQSRNSGINNWALFKGYIDRESEVQNKFAKINDTTQKLLNALKNRLWREAGALIAEEWAIRKTLAPGITTPEIDEAFQIASRSFPDVSGKICGAGGGGCFFFYFPNPLTTEQRTRLIAAVEATGVRHLPFQTVPKGLEIRNA